MANENVKVKAVDSFHDSRLGLVHAKTELVLSDVLARELKDKGLVELSKGKAATAPATAKKAAGNIVTPKAVINAPSNKKKDVANNK